MFLVLWGGGGGGGEVKTDSTSDLNDNSPTSS